MRSRDETDTNAEKIQQKYAQKCGQKRRSKPPRDRGKTTGGRGGLCLGKELLYDANQIRANLI